MIFKKCGVKDTFLKNASQKFMNKRLYGLANDWFGCFLLMNFMYIHRLHVSSVCGHWLALKVIDVGVCFEIVLGVLSL